MSIDRQRRECRFLEIHDYRFNQGPSVRASLSYDGIDFCGNPSPAYRLRAIEINAVTTSLRLDKLAAEWNAMHSKSSIGERHAGANVWGRCILHVAVSPRGQK